MTDPVDGTGNIVDFIDPRRLPPRRTTGGKRVVRVTNSNRNEAWREVERAILDSGTPVFVRGGDLVEPIRRSERGDDGTIVATTTFLKLNTSRMGDVATQIANIEFQNFDGRRRSGEEWAAVNPPSDVINSLLERGTWNLPTVVGIVHAPTIRPDGSLITEPGFDPPTGLWHAADGSLTLPSIPERPTRDDALDAVGALRSILSEFPLADRGTAGVDEAVVLAAMMTVVLRGSFTVAPMFLFHKPEAGTGASYLVKVISAMATGQPATPLVMSSVREEVEKTLAAAAYAGKPIINLNNLTINLDSALLCQIVTESKVDIRRFGKNDETMTCDCRSSTVLANGNNVGIVGDLVRRTLTARMDANMERPETRRFLGDPLADVIRDRGRYVAAAILIARAYDAADRPSVAAETMAGFGAWALRVQRPLVWLGLADPARSMEDARRRDPDRVLLARRVSSLWGAFGSSEFSAGQILGKINESREMDGVSSDLSEAFTRDGKPANSTWVGRILSSMIGRVSDGRWVASDRRNMYRIYLSEARPATTQAVGEPELFP